MAYRFVYALMAVVAVCTVPALSFSAGAPTGACGDLIPQHHTDPQKTPAPYTIQLNKNKVKSGEGMTVTVKGNTAKDTIKGLLCQARSGETPVGSFDVPPNNNFIQTLDCGNTKKSAVTHKKMTSDPKEISFNWVAPRGFSGDIRMTCTIALNGGVFWVKEQSAALKVN
ncbi:putative defense protein Hdd11 [Malaya genurostris]|uniref:putative defense protein Hdd11 n=1 Tax=Malaya genurostris TaxID=325434 RepID=UPI0026F3F281|nr:putative defense protein Hdd11 [Malaya genurostris]